MVNYKDTLLMPFTDVKATLIGLILSIIPIANFLAFGYRVRCANSAMHGDYKLPAWDAPVKLFLDGLIAIAIGIIYALPIIILTLLAGGSAYSTFVSQDVTNLVSYTPRFGTYLLMLFILFISTVYIMPAAVMAFVETGKFKSAFNLASLRPILTKQWFIGWLAYIIYYLVFLSIYLLLIVLLVAPITFAYVIPGLIIGIFIELSLPFIPAITAWTILGSAYSEAKKSLSMKKPSAVSPVSNRYSNY